MLTAFLAFLGGWGLSFVNDRRHKNQNIKDAYNSVLHELRENKEFLDKYEKKIIEINDDNFRANRVVIGVSRYDSLIYSGVFRLMDYDIQNLAVLVYGKIKEVNRHSYRMLEIVTNRNNIDVSNIGNISQYGETIDEQIDELKTEIPKLIKLIEERMPTSIF